MNPLHLIPAPLHRQLYRIAHRLRRKWYAITRKTVRGCSVVGRDTEGRFLLVRHSYGPDVWAFPGGGIGKHETPLVAAIRELREELGCALSETKRVARFTEPYLGATNVVHVFTGTIEGRPRPDRREIVEARFFARERFPDNISRTVATRMKVFDRVEAGGPPLRLSE